ncbi:hypothetical protein ACHQM5_020654 [Ranunculus cassubicifolius]
MDGSQNLGSVIDLSTENSRSGLKMTREQRIYNLDPESEFNCKRLKLQDLDSQIPSQGTGIHNSESLVCEQDESRLHFGKKQEVPENTKAPELMLLDTLSQPQSASCLSSHLLDSNSNPIELSANKDRHHNPNFVSAKSVGLSINADNGISSANQNPFYPYKLTGNAKSAEASECGSSTGPLEENESYRRWKEMKRNGFLSSAHGGIPVPDQTQRLKKRKMEQLKKKKPDSLKKKMEIAKREQVHRFTKIAAPSGLLNGLNPGIINHVRNSKQVHSIIEALVRSERHKSNIQNTPVEHISNIQNTSVEHISNIQNTSVEHISNIQNTPVEHISNIQNTSVEHISNIQKLKHSENNHDTVASQDPEIRLSLSERLRPKDYQVSLASEHKGRRDNTEIEGMLFYDETSGVSQITTDRKDGVLGAKLSSFQSTTLKQFGASNEEAGSHTSVSSLSARAATVASQWLELLNQDIKGRLAALRRSKKRVQAVIETELPFLMRKEFSSGKCPNSAISDMHRARWTALFGQMEKALTEEGRHLENKLNQVKEMQLQCERGLQCVNWPALQSLGRSENVPRPKMDTAERELAVRAAAASIYSTCNYVKATDAVSCF